MEKCGIEPFVLPIATRLSGESCAVSKQSTKYRIEPISSLPANLCYAWRVTVGRLYAALYLAYDDTDNLQEASYYTAHSHTEALCSSARDIQNFQGTKVGSPNKNCDEDFFKLSIDMVEYFPQPPIARANTSSRTLTCATGQSLVDKIISRPGRTYL